MSFPKELKYAKSHEWVKLEENTATIGISDFAVKQLSDLVFVDLPKSGTAVEKGKSFGEIESVKAVSDLYAPVDGEIVEVNDELADNLEWLSEAPYEKGWMVKVKVKDPAQVNELMDAEKYSAHVESEEH